MTSFMLFMSALTELEPVIHFLLAVTEETEELSEGLAIFAIILDKEYRKGKE